MPAAKIFLGRNWQDANALKDLAAGMIPVHHHNLL